MLDKFKWHVPSSNTGAGAGPFIKLSIRYKDERKSIAKKDIRAPKSTFQISKGLALDWELSGKIVPMAFSFDEDGSVLMALHAPDTVPHYLGRKSSGDSYNIGNSLFCYRFFEHTAKSTDKPSPDMTYHLFYNFEELKKDGDVRFFKLTRKPS